MKRYFFFDIDGTLTSPLTDCVPEDTKEAIRQLQAKGNFVALATGRLQCDAYHIAQQLGIRSVVSDGGNGLTIDGQLIYHRSLPPGCLLCLSGRSGRQPVSLGHYH